MLSYIGCLYSRIREVGLSVMELDTHFLLDPNMAYI